MPYILFLRAIKYDNIFADDKILDQIGMYEPQLGSN